VSSSFQRTAWRSIFSTHAVFHALLRADVEKLLNRHKFRMTGQRKLRGELPLGPVSGGVKHCPLCDRELPRDVSVDEHHLTPRSLGGKDKFCMHRICHRKIHATFSEKELAHSFNTWEALRAHEDMQTFIAWVAKKPISYWDNSRAAARKKK
jgi:hypothetical protein